MYSALIGASSAAWSVIVPMIEIILALISIAVIVIVLMQDGNTNNIVGVNARENESFYSKNKGATKESLLKKITIGLGVAFLVISILYFVLSAVFNG